jgi:hypothetical protein
MKVLIDSIRNLWVNTKVAAKDHTDLVMFLIIAVLAYLDINEIFYRPGTIGFLAFYIYFCLIRLATLKREIAEIQSPKSF